MDSDNQTNSSSTSSKLSVTNVDFSSKDWYRALSLEERVRLLRGDLLNISSAYSDTKTASTKLARWQSQSPFENKELFVRRLNMVGLSETEMLDLLSHPLEDFQFKAKYPPVWLRKIFDAFSKYVDVQATFSISTSTNNKNSMGDFLHLIDPLILHGIEDLGKKIQFICEKYEKVPFNRTTISQIFLPNLFSRLLTMMNRTMILELNIARLEEELTGETPEARYQSFIEKLRNRQFSLSILQEYPSLARLCILTIDQWVTFNASFLDHLCRDWAKITTQFGDEKALGELVDITAGVGDFHRDGKAVMVAKFSTGFQIVYKPRPLNVDFHFQELLLWLNTNGHRPAFPQLKLLPRDQYGWVEFIQPQSCHSVEEINRFYQRQGGYLALLYAIEAIDFHFENLIACGEFPILIDLESLFHQHVEYYNSSSKSLTGMKSLAFSVLRVGLLPQLVWGGENLKGVDVGGLSAQPGQVIPIRTPDWDQLGTDELHVSRRQGKLAGGKNRPMLNDNEIDLLDYREDLATGFENTYRFLLQKREQLLSGSGPLNAFREDETRFIVRPTNTYWRLLQESYHPDLLRNGLDRDRFFDRLWVGAEEQPFLEKIIPYEHKDLINNNIPIFSSRPNSRSLWSSTESCIPNYFRTTALTQVNKRLRKLCEKDLEVQLWFIRASLASLTTRKTSSKWGRARYLSESPGVFGAEQYMATASHVGDMVKRFSIKEDGLVSWIGLAPVTENQMSLMPMTVDLYSGLSGVALFFSYLGSLTKKGSYTRLAKETLITLRKQIDDYQSNINSLGAFDGWGGIIYTYVHLGILWEDKTLIQEAEHFVEISQSKIDQATQYDVMSGLAGYILCLLNLYWVDPSHKAILETALRCGKKLVQDAATMEVGLGWWNSSLPSIKPLAGFSHGTAGISLALFSLFEVTGDEEFREVAQKAIEYERSLFSATERNWPNLTKLSDDDNNNISYPVQWCHGAPGVALGRLLSLPYADSKITRNEIQQALQTTLEGGFGQNHCLCHGDLGNLDVLALAQEILGEQSWLEQIKMIGAQVASSIDKKGCICGVPIGVETPGLMTGLSGIGYGLLRLGYPKRVPSILSLALPPKINRHQSFPRM